MAIAIAIGVLLMGATIALAHGIGDPRLDKQQYDSKASLIKANYTKDDDFATELTAEKTECQQFTNSTSQARDSWAQTMHVQANTLSSVKSAWDSYRTWAVELAPSADLYKKSSLVRTASRKLAVGIGFEQDADGSMNVQSHAYAAFSCDETGPIDEAKQDLAKGKENIKAGLSALKTAVDAER